MNRDDFFEQLARDHYPGPLAVYDGPDGTARRPARSAQPRRVARTSVKHRNRRASLSRVALSAALSAGLVGAAVLLIVVTSSRHDPLQGSVTVRPEGPTARSNGGPRVNPRPREATRTRRPESRSHPSRPDPAVQHRSATASERLARAIPVATPRGVPGPSRTATPPVPAPTRATPPVPARTPVAPSSPPPVAREPSCEFPPC